MKALIYRGVHQFGIEEISEPVISDPEWVKIKVKAAGLCGSDLHKLLYDEPKHGYLETQILGHEIAGEIVECGNSVTHYKIGDHVIVEPQIPCNNCSYCKRGNYHLCSDIKCIGRHLAGGFAEFVCCPQSNLFLLPENISFAEGAFIDSVAVAVHCFHLVKPPQERWKAGIIGDGPLGLICLQLANAFGANHVTLFGKHYHNLQVAANFGASKVIQISQISSEITKLRNSFDVVIEAVGGRQSETLQLCIDLVTFKGTIGVLGVYDFNFYGSLPLRQAFYKESRILGLNSYSIWGGKREFDIALESLEKRLVDVKPLITNLYPLSRFQDGLNAIKRKNETSVIKVIFEP